MQPYRSDLRLLPNPLEVRAYPFRVREKPEPRLVWLRAFQETYNPTLAPRVLADLSSDYPHASLTMIGPDKGDGSLARTRECARRLNVESRVTFVGGVPKTSVGEHICRGDVFLNTTNVDNAPVSVLEALACGLSVVSTNVGGMPDLVADGQEALLVPPDDPAAMAAAIRRVLGEPGLAARLSRNGRRKAEAMDWSVVLPQWETLLSAASGANNRRMAV
jgi:glycosyltransferase involved in cell wall biosynthesis